MKLCPSAFAWGPLGSALLLSVSASAQTGPLPPIPPAMPAAPSPSASTAPANPAHDAVVATAPPSAPPGRAFILGPPALEVGQHFTIDPVTDGVLIGGSGGVSILLSLILGTGEIEPAAPNGPGAASSLLWIDRLAVTQHIDPNAGTYSTIALGAAISFAAIDPLLSAWRDGWDAGLVDAIMYGETISLTEALTDITKIAVRRPRPIDYFECSVTKPPANCENDTDLSLSFFSGHAATVGAIGATATYLAFQRTGIKHWRGWVTLGASLALTTFTSIERVRSGEHFPTDVIAGSLAGGMVGTLVPHLHKHAQEAPPVWIGFAPAPGGGSMTVGAVF